MSFAPDLLEACGVFSTVALCFVMGQKAFKLVGSPGASKMPDIMAKAKAPRERLQALLIARWQEMGELSLLHHRQVQLLLDTLRREKELVSVQLIELLLTDLYDQEFPSH